MRKYKLDNIQIINLESNNRVYTLFNLKYDCFITVADDVFEIESIVIDYIENNYTNRFKFYQSKDYQLLKNYITENIDTSINHHFLNIEIENKDK